MAVVSFIAAGPVDRTVAALVHVSVPRAVDTVLGEGSVLGVLLVVHG